MAVLFDVDVNTGVAMKGGLGTMVTGTSSTYELDTGFNTVYCAVATWAEAAAGLEEIFVTISGSTVTFTTGNATVETFHYVVFGTR